ncbi:MAG TPA: hypothetical protein VFQ37_07825 [Mycobacterium sp.]|nr:hypothetical protein [Mycobacterium sp.]
MGDYCRACRANLVHCHGTLIRHPLRRPDCTDDDCADFAVILHAFVIDCDAVGCGCAEAPPALAAG